MLSEIIKLVRFLHERIPASSEGNVHFERVLYSHLLSDLSTPCRAYADLRICDFH